MTRLPVTKTPKPYVGGAFIRSESGRTFPVRDAEGNFFANIPQCTRKDLRNAVEAAAKNNGFGPLPNGFSDDVLPVIFSFDPTVVH